MAEKAVGIDDVGTEDSRSVPLPTQDGESEEIHESFICCVCLDLLYKPVVLSCGHMSCFWCVHKSMNGFHVSRCPICRHPYIYFPSICQMLHFLLLKIYPDTYEEREKQTLEEERKIRTFSPQFDAELRRSQGDEHLSSGSLSQSYLCNLRSNSSSNVGSSANSDSQPSTSMTFEDSVATAKINGSTSPQVLAEGSQSKDWPKNGLNESQNKISIADVLCGSCKQLLFRPVALNCGHVFCECCIPDSEAEKFKCHVCQSRHPGGPPKVCLALDHFLEIECPNEYALRKSTAQLKETIPKNQSHETFVSPGNGEADKDRSLKTHFEVGCDYCGMFPIVGDRYQCQDCVEDIGFDLCGDCYNSRCKLPGRFNQQHRPEHKFRLRRPDNFMRSSMLRFLSRRSRDGTTDPFLSGEDLENVVISHVPRPPTNDTRENAGYEIGLGFTVEDDTEENADYSMGTGLTLVDDTDADLTVGLSLVLEDEEEEQNDSHPS